MGVGPLGCSGGATWPGSGVITGVPMLMPGTAHAGGKATVTLIWDWPLGATRTRAGAPVSSRSLP